ncbi:hypothetical protein [Streptomyces canus]|uniref:hypothetical protein n=1 Tax=Streptomyces canus TaxID=58343 RepID=UPI0038671254|nr:hypothetical protein OH824_14170 [Streptomyces canus]
MKLDWDGKHGPITGPINTGVAALAVGYAGHEFGMPWEWSALTAGAGLLGTHIAGRRHKVTRSTLALRAAGWLGAGGWCSWAIVNGPWSQAGLGSLIVGALGLGAAMVGAHHVEAKAEEERAEQEAAARRATLDGKRRKIADEWEDRIVRVCAGTVVQIVGVEAWESDGGFTLDGQCGQGGTTWKNIKAFEDNLAADAALPEGCGVEIKPGANRGAFLIDVSTVNALIDDAPYPNDYTPLSVNDPAPLGIHRDRTVFAPVTRQRSGLTVGQKGTGKTNLMNVKIANQCRTVDVLPWVIDLNGGGLALAWLHAWHNAGRPGRPPVDWVADTPRKALALSQAMVRVALARKPGYKHLEIEANDDKLPVTKAVPAIVCNNDEIAELFSPRARRDPILREVGDNLVRVQELGRAAATNVENAALRATQDVISEPQILKQSALRIGLRCDEAELSYLFGWNDRLSPEDAPYPGCGFYKVDQDPARPFKVYRITPDQIRDIVVATADLHPELDDLSRRAAGEAYEQRWMGCDHLFGLGPAPLAAPEETPATPSPRGRGVTADWGSTPAGGDAQATIDQAEEARRKLHEAMNETGRHDGDLDAQFMDILAGGGVTWKPPATEQPAPPVNEPADGDPRREMVFGIVEKAGTDGIGPEAIREIFDRFFRPHGYETPHAATIGRWLAADPRVHKPGYGRYAVRPDEN